MFENFERRQIDIGEVVINLRIGGEGPPLLLLHGYPQSHVMWHKVAPRLARDFTVIAPDLRGYGDSGKPESDPKHEVYSKRATANDQVKLMEALGFAKFKVAGHDRGARVTHRLCLDHPERVERACIMDIVPTPEVFGRINKRIASAYYHWFFLIQPYDFPETLIGANPGFYLRRMLRGLSGEGAFTPEAMAEYVRTFSSPETIHATCEDYRAAASIDLEHHKADNGRKIACPLLLLWGSKGVVGTAYDPLALWREWAEDVTGQALECGHFLPEEAPDATYAAMAEFFGRR